METEQEEIDTDRDLGIVEVKVLSFMEQTFWEEGGIPSDEIVSSQLGLTLRRIKECWELKKFRAALVARGINISPAELTYDPDTGKVISPTGVLDPRQIVLANLLMNTLDKRSVRQKLEEVGVSQQQYNSWMRQRAFQSYMRRRAEELFKSSDPVAYLSFIKNVESGNMDALKMFFEMRGIYSPKGPQVEVNLDSILLKVVEILSKFLNADQLQAAAAELESILPKKAEALEISSGSVPFTGI